MRFLFLVVAVLVLAACTSDPVPGPPPPAPVPLPKPAPHPAVPRAKDREVLDTLASLDPCALLGGGHVQPGSPHLCQADGVTLVIGERTSRAGRFPLPTKVIAGAKVDAIKKTSDRCTLEIPVSFRYAVALGAPTCAPLDGVAADVIARLHTPGKVRHPADEPDLSKDACAVLEGALTDVGQDFEADDVSPRDNLDDCRLALPSFGHIGLTQDLQPPTTQTRSTTIAGKGIHTTPVGCRWWWSEGAYPGKLTRTVSLGMECPQGAPRMPAERSNKLIGAVITQLGKPQAPAKATKLTYSATEADEPNPAACVDYPLDSCEPYQPTPVPAGTGPATRMAQVDSHVTCAAAHDAVHAQFPALTPVVDTQQLTCVFVQPDHVVQLAVDVQLSADNGSRPIFTRAFTVAGHRAEYREYRDRLVDSLCVDSGVRSQYSSADSLWCVTATFRAPRNDPEAKPNTSGAAKLAPVMAAVVAEYLNR